MTVRRTRTGEAGPRGRDVRSDCWIGLKLRSSGGLSLTIESKVESLYGKSLRWLLEEGLKTLGIGHAEVRLEDGGALPFTVAARLEAAARRALPELDREYLRPPRRTKAAYDPPVRDRLRRSRLYLPGNEPKFMPNAHLHGADGVILDLEDSVAPAVKDEARLLVRNALRELDFGTAERMVRINQLPRGLEDIPFLVRHGVQVILLPKCEGPEDVRRVAEALEKSRRGGGRKGRPAENRPFLMPIIESARGATRAAEIASASPLVVALTIGLEDYTADIGAVKSETGEESFWARSQVVNGARAAGVVPIDSVYSDVMNMEGLEAWGRRSRAMGFVGMGCIHPRQIQVIHRAYAPTAKEIERATRIVEAFEKSEAEGLGVVALGSKMIDAPVVKRAQDTVRQAREMGLLDQGTGDKRVRRSDG